MNFDAAEQALKRSITGVIVKDTQHNTIGMGRIVGDGQIYFYIQDIVVTPQYQKQGIGTKILNSLMLYIKDNAPAKSFIGLFSVPDALDFYRQFTFEKRDLVGLFTVKEILVETKNL